MENTSLDKTRYLLARKSALIFFWVVLFATIVRPFFADLPIILTYIGIFNTAASGIIYLFLRFTPPKPIHIYIVIGIGIVCVIPLLLMSGGVNSQFAPLMLVLPIFVCLLGRAKIGLATSIFIVILIITMRIYEAEISALDVISYDIRAVNARTFWLCLGTAFSFYIGSQFDTLSGKLTSKLNTQANIDELTQIYNRRSILEKIDELNTLSASNGQWVSLLMIDVDHFKSINDSYGHDFGDKCLQLISTCLQETVRSDLDKVGRYGGEEFLVMLNGANGEQAKAIAEKIRHAVTLIQADVAGESIGFSVTIGFASFEAGQQVNIQEVLKLADLALYKGKRESRNCIVAASQYASEPEYQMSS